jgi:hypothetical protein
MDFDLAKKAETFTFELAKKGVTDAPVMAVWAALDISGSMDDEIADGSMQTILDQFGGVAIKFDDNNEIDIVKFDDQVDYVGTWTVDDYKTFVRNRRINVRGGTSYSPFINYIVNNRYGSDAIAYETVTKTRTVKGFMGFGSKTEEYQERVPMQSASGAKEPTLVLVLTDGDPNSERIGLIQAALRSASAHPIFFAFIGFSNQSTAFNTLKQLDKEFDNVGFITAKFGAKDADLYADLITPKLLAFIKRFPAKVSA